MPTTTYKKELYRILKKLKHQIERKDPLWFQQHGMDTVSSFLDYNLEYKPTLYRGVMRQYVNMLKTYNALPELVSVSRQGRKKNPPDKSFDLENSTGKAQLRLVCDFLNELGSDKTIQSEG